MWPFRMETIFMRVWKNPFCFSMALSRGDCCTLTARWRQLPAGCLRSRGKKQSWDGVSFKNNWFIKPRYDRITKVFTEIQTQPGKAENSVKHSTCTNYSVKGSRGKGGCFRLRQFSFYVSLKSHLATIHLLVESHQSKTSTYQSTGTITVS